VDEVTVMTWHLALVLVVGLGIVAFAVHEALIAIRHAQRARTRVVAIIALAAILIVLVIHERTFAAIIGFLGNLNKATVEDSADGSE